MKRYKNGARPRRAGKSRPAFLGLCAAACLLASCSPSPPVSLPPSGALSPSAPASLSPPSPSPVPVSLVIPSLVIDPPDDESNVARDWEDNGLSLTSLNFQKDYEGGGGVLLRARALFPQTGLEIVDAYYAACREDFERQAENLSHDAEASGGLLMGGWELEADYVVECSMGGLFSVSRVMADYQGGVHGSCYVLCETFAVSDGRLLSLDSFFSAERNLYTERLLAAMEPSLAERSEELYENAGELIRDFFPYDSFVVTPLGLSFFFPPYELGPYSSGIVRIDVGWNDLHDIWRTPA